jgi:hypothetical protein
MNDKPIGYGLYLIGPVMENDDGGRYFVMAFGGPRSFTIDYMPLPDRPDADEMRASYIRAAKNGAFSAGGAEEFDDEHELLKRAVEIWPNRKTKRALAEFEESMALAERLNADVISRLH